MLKARSATIQDSLQSLEAIGSEDEKQMANSQMARTAALYQQLQDIVNSSDDRP
jgi:hypothetical protein